MATYSSQLITYGQAYLETVAAANKTAPMTALIASGKLRLSNNPALVANPQATISQLAADECAYSGYTAGGIAVTLSGPLILSNSAVGMLCTGTFLATTATPFVSDSAHGYWIDDGTNVILVEAFPPGTVFSFAQAGAFLELVVLIPLQTSQATS